jgi:hypothetical protein
MFDFFMKFDFIRIISSNENDKKQISINAFAPKATVKTKGIWVFLMKNICFVLCIISTSSTL